MSESQSVRGALRGGKKARGGDILVHADLVGGSRLNYTLRFEARGVDKKDFFGKVEILSLMFVSFKLLFFDEILLLLLLLDEIELFEIIILKYIFFKKKKKKKKSIE